MDSAINRDSIMPSRQSRAERRWVRWNARPIRPKMNADEMAKWVGVIERLRTLTPTSWAETKCLSWTNHPLFCSFKAALCPLIH